MKAGKLPAVDKRLPEPSQLFVVKPLRETGKYGGNWRRAFTGPADHENGNLGANAIVGGSAGIATGAAFSAKQRGTSQVAVCFFGEGALGQGLLYEVLNMASLWTLPVVYVCENNLYNEYTHYLEATAGDILARPRAFGIEAREVDGQDVRAVFSETADLVAA